MTTYELYYWPVLQGRGELPRLVLEDAQVPYRDVARHEGAEVIFQLLRGELRGLPPLAPPALRVDGRWMLSQSTVLCAFLGERHGLAPTDEAERWIARQLQATVSDLVDEAHDTHHPLGVGAHYEDQRPEAARRAKEFAESRIPKFLSYLEDVRAESESRSGEGLLSVISYVDLSLFQVVEGLRFAFPNAMRRVEARIPKVLELVETVRRRPGLAAYLASERRLPFNEHGIFRHYPELDAGSMEEDGAS